MRCKRLQLGTVMADYESLAHLSRWRRLVIWLFEDKVGYSITSLVFVLLLGLPIYFFKGWGLALVAAALLGFLVGYRLASSFAKSGQLPPEI